MRFKFKSFVLELAALIAVASSFGAVKVLGPVDGSVVFADGEDEDDAQLVDVDDDDDDDGAVYDDDDDDGEDEDDENDEDNKVDDENLGDILKNLVQSNANMSMKQTYFDIFLDKQRLLNKLIGDYAAAVRAGTGFGKKFKENLKKLGKSQNTGHATLGNSVMAAMNMLKSECAYCKILDKKIKQREGSKLTQTGQRVFKSLLKIRSFLADWIRMFLSVEEQKKLDLKPSGNGLGFVLRNELVDVENKVSQNEEKGSNFVISVKRLDKFKKNIGKFNKELSSKLKSLREFLESSYMEGLKSKIENREKRRNSAKKRQLSELLSKKKGKTSRSSSRSSTRSSSISSTRSSSRNLKGLGVRRESPLRVVKVKT